MHDPKLMRYSPPLTSAISTWRHTWVLDAMYSSIMRIMDRAACVCAVDIAPQMDMAKIISAPWAGRSAWRT